MPKKALKLKKLLIALLFIIIGKTQLIAENLIESGSWIYFADNVMGGISVGSSEYVIEASGKAIRLYGEVSTKNNGGFIQVRMPYSIDQLEKYKGIKDARKASAPPPLKMTTIRPKGYVRAIIELKMLRYHR